ncbi:MAG TPA: SxtJ family membrane protein [Verrucomicrobiae bacterium]|nr:SxtJ family membrane protein [Verrucomicrobiae bacterium]
MRWSELPLNPTHRMLRQFSAACIVAALVGYGCFALAATVSGVLAVAGVIGLIWPGAVRWLFVTATIAAFPIGWVVTHAILVFLFFVIMTPIGIALRLRGRDEMQLKPLIAKGKLKRSGHRDTYWHERGEPSPPENYLKQY